MFVKARQTAAPPPGQYNISVPADQIHGAPEGVYFSGAFTMTVGTDGKTTFTNWAVFLNFAWGGGGRTAIPQPT